MPDFNVTGQDFADRSHLTYAGGPIVDFHCHVMLTREKGAPEGAPGSSDQAALMLDVAADFGVGCVVSMCPAADIAPLRGRLGAGRIRFNAMINKKADEPDDAAYRNLDEFLAAGVDVVKLWAAPRGRDRGLTMDAPWRIQNLRRARAAGVRVVMAHVADPDRWWGAGKPYEDTSVYGTKAEQYDPLRRLLGEFPDMTWVAAHMAGDPERPDHLEELLTEFPHLMIDTSATKWQVREVSQRVDAAGSLVTRFADRFLFGSDLVTRHGLERGHYESRYWCQRTLWDSAWRGRSPIQDPDHGGPQTPELNGVGLPADVLRKVYRENALRILGSE